jgi:hypothetical protein
LTIIEYELSLETGQRVSFGIWGFRDALD